MDWARFRFCKPCPKCGMVFGIDKDGSNFRVCDRRCDERAEQRAAERRASKVVPIRGCTVTITSGGD